MTSDDQQVRPAPGEADSHHVVWFDAERPIVGGTVFARDTDGDGRGAASSSEEF